MTSLAGTAREVRALYYMSSSIYQREESTAKLGDVLAIEIH